MNIAVRRGRMKDMPFVRRLMMESVHYGIPSTRRISPDEVRRHLIQANEDLEMAIYSRDVALIIAEDLDAKRAVGYLILLLNQTEDCTGEKQSFIHDIAVEKEYWGKYIPDRLMARAEEITREKKLLYIVGQITSDNRRPLIYSTKRLGYAVERHQIVKVLE